MTRGLVLAAIAAFVGIGAWAVLDPVAVGSAVGLPPEDALGRVELVAMYGGLQFGIAAFLAWTLLDPTRTRVGLVAATFALTGIGLGRLAAWLVWQPDGWLMPALWIVELSAVPLGGGQLWRTRHD